MTPLTIALIHIQIAVLLVMVVGHAKPPRTKPRTVPPWHNRRRERNWNRPPEHRGHHRFHHVWSGPIRPLPDARRKQHMESYVQSNMASSSSRQQHHVIHVKEECEEYETDNEVSSGVAPDEHAGDDWSEYDRGYLHGYNERKFNIHNTKLTHFTKGWLRGATQLADTFLTLRTSEDTTENTVLAQACQAFMEMEAETQAQALENAEEHYEGEEPDHYEEEDPGHHEQGLPGPMDHYYGGSYGQYDDVTGYEL